MKPSTKLVNAWIAGVQALLGPEPGFQDIRQTPLDYFEVKTPVEVLNAIHRLRSQPALYEQMVSNGLKRAGVYRRCPGPEMDRCPRGADRGLLSPLAEVEANRADGGVPRQGVEAEAGEPHLRLSSRTRLSNRVREAYVRIELLKAAEV